MYTKKTYHLKKVNEVEYTYAGNYGAKGEKRQPRAKPTPEQIKKQNQKNKENKVRRLILLNFDVGDFWITLKYKAGYRPSTEVVRRDWRNFIKRLGRQYKKRGKPLKYIYRIEIGKQGGVHIHAIINNVGTGRLIAEEWEKVKSNAGINVQYLHEDGGYKELAEYLVKKPKGKAMEQISMFPEEEQQPYIRYQPSRNLEQPEPEQEEKKKLTMARILRDGPEPTPGYYIDKSTIVQGINKFTGYSYLRYTERRLEERKRGDPPWT